MSAALELSKYTEILLGYIDVCAVACKAQQPTSPRREWVWWLGLRLRLDETDSSCVAWGGDCTCVDYQSYVSDPLFKRSFQREGADI
jgi:hypothetical protein